MQGGRVIDPIPDIPHDGTVLLQHVDDLFFLVRFHLCKHIRFADSLTQRFVAERPHFETRHDLGHGNTDSLTDRRRHGFVIAGNDLQADTQLLQFFQRLTSISFGRVSENQKTQKSHLPLIRLAHVSNLVPPNGQAQHSQAFATHPSELVLDRSPLRSQISQFTRRGLHGATDFQNGSQSSLRHQYLFPVHHKPHAQPLTNEVVRNLIQFLDPLRREDIGTGSLRH